MAAVLRGPRRRRPAAAAPGDLPRPRTSTRSAADRSETSIEVRSNSRAASGGKRGSRNAAAIALSRTSAPSGRRALERADAAAELARLPERDERGRGLARARHATSGDGAEAELRADRRTRDASSSGAAEVSASVIGAFRFGERERGITDDARLVARRVARIAQVEKLRRKPAPPRRQEEAVDRRRAARLLVIERRRERQDRVAGRAIEPARVGIPVIVRKVGADDDQRLLPPQSRSMTSPTSCAVASPTANGTMLKVPSTACRNGSWTSSECSSACAASLVATWRQRQREIDRGAIDGHGAERRRERSDRRQREPAHRHAMRRAEQHDAADRLAAGCEARIGRRGDRSRIHVAGVRHDDRLGHAGTRFPRASPAARCARTSAASIEGALGVEHAGHGGRAYVSQTVAPDRACANPLAPPSDTLRRSGGRSKARAIARTVAKTRGSPWRLECPGVRARDRSPRAAGRSGRSASTACRVALISASMVSSRDR